MIYSAKHLCERQYWKAHVHPKDIARWLIFTQTENQKIAGRKSHVRKAQSKCQPIKALYLTMEPFWNNNTSVQCLLGERGTVKNTLPRFDWMILFELLRTEIFINSTILALELLTFFGPHLFYENRQHIKIGWLRLAVKHPAFKRIHIMPSALPCEQSAFLLQVILWKLHVFCERCGLKQPSRKSVIWLYDEWKHLH